RDGDVSVNEDVGFDGLIAGKRAPTADSDALWELACPRKADLLSIVARDRGAF
ncbi:MAG: hypothetical protein JWQ69_3760, partial [Pseudomonas sp.]|nr:hypothetical protein [Pseudomonas sp.]